MSLLSDFKTRLGISVADNDQYLISYYLAPAIDEAVKVSTNLKQTTVSLVTGTQSYDLLTVASPVVTNGIQELFYDFQNPWQWTYKKDFFIRGRTELYFVDTDLFSTTTFTFKYNEMWSYPTTAPVETDMPTPLFPAVIRYATALFKLQKLGGGANSDIDTGLQEGAEEIREELMMRKNGRINDQQKVLQDELESARQEMREFGGMGLSSRYNLWNKQVI